MEVGSKATAKPLRPASKRLSFRIAARPVPIAISAGVLAFAAWFGFGERGLWERHKLAQRFESQAEQLAQLEAEKTVLQAYLNELKAGDEHALEQAAREQHLAAANETIYDINVEPTPVAK
jgi:cell division protein FtsB